MGRAIRALFAALVLGGAQSAAAEPPPAMTSGAYGIKVEDVVLRDALHKIAKTFDLRLKADGLASERVRGTLRAPSAAALLDQFASRYGFTWFVYSGVLHVSDTRSNETARLRVGKAATTESARNLLVASRLYEPKFGWIEQADDGFVLVNGPAEYLALVRKVLTPLLEAHEPTIAAEKANSDRPELMVFRLRHANAEDRIVSYRGQSVTMPGLATTIRAAMGGARLPPAAGAGQGVVLPPDAMQAAGNVMRTLPAAVRAAADPNPGRAEPSFGLPPDAATYLRARPWTVNIAPDGRTNSLLVFDLPDRRPVYERIIADLDVAQHLVEIEAIIIDIDRRWLAELGVEWSASGARAGYSGTLSAVPGLPSTTFVIPNIDQFFARLRALDTTGEATILGRPSVLTLDNQAAVLDLNTTDFIRVVGERVAEVKEVTAGTSLRVTPRVLTTGASTSVQLLVDIEDGAVQPADRGGTPTVQRSTISTQASIVIGQSLVVGGYRSNQQRRELNKVPFLGSVPILGNAFRSARSEDRNLERLFVITPRAIDGTASNRLDAPPAPTRGVAVDAAARRLVEPVDVAPRRPEAGPAVAPITQPSLPGA